MLFFVKFKIFSTIFFLEIPLNVNTKISEDETPEFIMSAYFWAISLEFVLSDILFKII